MAKMVGAPGLPGACGVLNENSCCGFGRADSGLISINYPPADNG